MSRDVSPLDDVIHIKNRGAVNWTDRHRRLHLGCGDRYLPGYTNVDFPEEATVQKRRHPPDIIGDFTKMAFPAEWFGEIRLHHVFEHFQRHIALGLLCQWHRMLLPGGQLVLAVPDVERAMSEFLLAGTPEARRHELIRHMWGSHEAGWATHHEGWYAESLEGAMLVCGYVGIQVEKHGGKWAEIILTGTKRHRAPVAEVIELFLSSYDAGDGMLKGWMEHIRSKIL